MTYLRGLEERAKQWLFRIYCFFKRIRRMKCWHHFNKLKSQSRCVALFDTPNANGWKLWKISILGESFENIFNFCWYKLYFTHSFWSKGRKINSSKSKLFDQFFFFVVVASPFLVVLTVVLVVSTFLVVAPFLVVSTFFVVSCFDSFPFAAAPELVVVPELPVVLSSLLPPPWPPPPWPLWPPWWPWPPLPLSQWPSSNGNIGQPSPNEARSLHVWVEFIVGHWKKSSRRMHIPYCSLRLVSLEHFGPKPRENNN